MAEPKVQTTIILAVEQMEAIQRLCAEWGDASSSSVIRRLIAEALEARRGRAVMAP